MKRVVSLALVLGRTVRMFPYRTALLFIAFMTLFFAVKNGVNAITVFGFTDMSFFERVRLFFSVLFDRENTFSLPVFSLLTLAALSQSFVIICFYSYMSMRNEKLHTEKASILVTTVLALFGTSCAACGGAALTLFSSFGIFGVGASFARFDSVIALSLTLVLLWLTLYRLLKKVENPFVC